MNCQYCKNIFSTKTSLNSHQKTAKYCLQLRNIKITPIYKCGGCNKQFSRAYHLRRHESNCTSNERFYELEQKLYEKDTKISGYVEKIKEKDMLLLKYEKIISELQDKLENIAIRAVSKTTSINTKNIQINNFLKNAPPLTEQVIEDNVQHLTLEHHVQGAEGYAKYAMEFPFKGRIVCVDVTRNKIKYKDGDGNVIEDVGFRKMMMKLCKALYTRSYDLSIEHLEKLSQEFTEKELEQYDYLEAAKAITMYSKGSESEFCRKVVKMISQMSNNKKCIVNEFKKTSPRI